MIKKILSFLIISFVGISFCSSFSCNSSQNYCWDMDINQSVGSTRGTVIDNNLNFYGLTFDYYNGNNRLLSIWWQEDGLFRTARNSNINISAFDRKGYINGYYICTQRLTEGVDITDMSFCSYQSDTFTGLSLGLKNSDKYMFNCLNTNSNSNYVSCSVCSYNSEGGDYYCVDNRVHAVGNINSFWSREEIMYYATNNPYSTNQYIPEKFSIDGNIQTINSDLDNTIRYYEQRYGWDMNMCYVGTDNLTAVYGDNVEFELGSGKTIFELYYSLYNTFGSNTFNNVGSFINVNLLNYASWYENLDSPDDRLYMAQYNGPDTNISMIYTGFTFPFANKPVAQYFMTDNIYNIYLKESSQGIEIAYYCDLLLKYHEYDNGTLNFEDARSKIDSSILDRIGLYVDRDLYPNNGYLVSSGSLWGVNSGYGIPTDISPSNLFSDFYLKVNSLFGSFSPFHSIGIIPWWILYPMIFLILFRILKH